MNIAFLTRYDPRDINNWSGIFYHIYHKLKEKNCIEIIGPEILGQRFQYDNGNFSYETFIPADRYVRNISQLISERIKELKCDLIFFGDLFFIPSGLNLPFVLFSDMTYEQVRIHYRNKLHDDRDVDPCMNLEKIGLNSASRIIYSSEWIKQKAIEIYQIDQGKIEVVEFGANIPNPTNYSIEINTDVCRLLFIGMDWERKNGDLVLQIFELLKKDGFPCTCGGVLNYGNEIYQ